MAKNRRLCNVLKVLLLIWLNFLKFWRRYNTRQSFRSLKLQITFQHSDFVWKTLFICYERQRPLPCEGIYFIIFSLILHHKDQNNLFE